MTQQLDKMYDLVILDLDMPVCDGYDACQQIKMLFTKQVIPAQDYETDHKFGGTLADYIPWIVAVSGYIDADTENKIQQTGFDSYFEQPLSVDKINDLIVPDVLKRMQQIQEMENIDMLYYGVMPYQGN
jgi:CheY-like chemotaxis protein